MRVCAAGSSGFDWRGLLKVIFFIASLGSSGVSLARTVDQAQAKSPKVFNVREFGAVADGKALDTAAIAKAIQAASAAGGGRVVFPPGIYLSGTFELLSNVALDLQANAVILGSPHLSDYGSIAQLGFAHVYGENSTGEGDRAGIIVARNAENIAILGQGAVDGNADLFYDFKKPHFGEILMLSIRGKGKIFRNRCWSWATGAWKRKMRGGPGR